MRSDSFGSFFSLSRMLAMAAIAVVAAAHYIADTFKAAAVHVVNVLASPAKSDEGTGLGQPQRLLQAAQAFYARIVKRDRPSIQGTWRMCPSC